MSLLEDNVWPTYCQADVKMAICFVLLNFYMNLYFESQYPKHTTKKGGPKIGRKVKGFM